MSASRDTGPDTLAEGELRALLEKLSGEYNFDFREYKPVSLERRIRARMAQVHVDSFATYAAYLDRHAGEHVQLFNSILINVTGFFRDPDAWKVVAEELIPRVVSEAAGGRSIRIWSAGCSSGEEPFSVAILLAEHLGASAENYNFKIYGTDIDGDALVTARHAMYRLDQVKDVPAPLLDRYFTRDGQLYRLRRDLRRWCILGEHNLSQAPPLSHVDLLLCRNVLIYFTSALQQRVLERFHYAIRPNGYLFLGRSESLLARSQLFTPIDMKWRIFQRIPVVTRQPTASLPPGEGNAGEGTGQIRGSALTAAGAQRALEALPAAVIIVDMQDTILTWNAAAEALFDVPAGSAVGRKFRDLDVSYRVEGLRARIEEVKVRHAPVQLADATFARRNRETVHADIVIAPLVEGHRLVGVLVYTTDGTEHARLREQMSRIAEQHSTAIEELQSTNEELETTNEELQSTTEELETTVEELQAANTELATLNAELEGRTAELRRLDAEHYGLVNSLEQPIFVVDRSLVVRTWNQATQRLWAIGPDYALGRQLFALPITAPVVTARDRFEAVLSGGTAAHIRKVPYTAPGGELTTLTLTLLPLRDGDGAVLGVIATGATTRDDERTTGEGSAIAEPA